LICFYRCKKMQYPMVSGL